MSSWIVKNNSRNNIRNNISINNTINNIKIDNINKLIKNAYPINMFINNNTNICYSNIIIQNNKYDERDISVIITKNDNNSLKFETITVDNNFNNYTIILCNNIININNKIEIKYFSNITFNNIQENKVIPNTIIQTWKTDVIDNTELYYPSIVLKKMNPEYNFILYNDDDCINFIKEYFNDYVLDAYNTIKPTAFKSDLFRYLYLYIYGGIYIDIKTFSVQPLFYLLENKSMLLVNERWNKGIYNGIIGITPKHDIIYYAINESINRIANRYYDSNPENTLELTGPSLFGFAYKKFFNITNNITIDNTPSYICWLRINDDELGRIMYNNSNIRSFNRNFTSYYSKYNNLNNHYHQMWINNDIYNNTSFNTNSITGNILRDIQIDLSYNILDINYFISNSEYAINDITPVILYSKHSINIMTYTYDNSFKPYKLHYKSNIFNIYYNNITINTTLFINYKKIIANMNIPKNIIYTWEDNKYPSNFNYCITLFKKFNPEYNLLFFDNNDRINFIKENYNNDVINAYNMLNVGAYKADLFRYCYLYTYGGIYIDIKMVLKRSLNYILKDTNDLLLVNDILPNNIANGFICVKPKHNLIKSFIDESLERITNKYYGSSSLDITGPQMCGYIYNIFKISNNCNNYNNFLKLLIKNNNTNDVYIINNNNDIVMYRNYSTYYLIYNNNHYGDLWNKKIVYI